MTQKQSPRIASGGSNRPLKPWGSKGTNSMFNTSTIDKFLSPPPVVPASLLPGTAGGFRVHPA